MKYGWWNDCIKLSTFDEYAGVFPDKVIPDMDFTDEVVVQFDVPDVKNTFLGTGNLQMIANKFWCEYLWVAYLLFIYCLCVACIVLVSSEIEGYNLRSWLREK